MGRGPARSQDNKRQKSGPGEGTTGPAIGGTEHAGEAHEPDIE